MSWYGNDACGFTRSKEAPRKCIVAGVAGGVAGALIERLIAFSRSLSRSVSKCGGWGKRESEGVAEDWESLKVRSSLGKLGGARRFVRVC